MTFLNFYLFMLIDIMLYPIKFQCPLLNTIKERKNYTFVICLIFNYVLNV